MTNPTSSTSPHCLNSPPRTSKVRQHSNAQIVWLLSFAAAAMLGLTGCSNNPPEQPTVQYAEPELEDHWVEVPTNLDDEYFTLETRLFPVKLPYPEDELWPYDAGGGTIFIASHSAGSKDALVVQIGVGYGVYMPRICIYEKDAMSSIVKYVWSEPHATPFGYTLVTYSERSFTLQGEYLDYEDGGRPVEYEETFPWPREYRSVQR